MADEEEKRGPGRPRKFTPQQMIEALTASGGVRTAAAAWLGHHTGLGCTYDTVLHYINEFPEVREALPTIKEMTLDEAEIGLVAQIRRGNMTAIMFYLNNHGQSRGYNRRPILTARNESYARAIAEAEAAAAADWDLSHLSDEEFAILEHAFARKRGGGGAGPDQGAAEAGPDLGGGKPRPVH